MKYLMIFLISMLPLIELRGAVLYGISENLNFYALLLFSILGNIIVVPFIYYFSRKILEFGKEYRLFRYILEKGHKVGIKLQKNSKYGIYFALMIFVGIPMPGSGVWSGTLAASILDLDFKKTMLANTLGLLISFCIMNIVGIIIF